MKRKRYKQLFLFIFCPKGNHWQFGWDYYPRQSSSGHSSWCKFCIDEDSRQRREMRRDAMMIKIQEKLKRELFTSTNIEIFTAKRSENPHVIIENFIGKEIIIKGTYYKVISIGCYQDPDLLKLSLKKIIIT
jgi:hypothetical protein